MNKMTLAIKSMQLLGWKASFRFVVYQILLKLGSYRIITPSKNFKHNSKHLTLNLPSFKSNNVISSNLLIVEADEICDGQVCLFGGDSTELKLNPIHQPKHWSKYHSSQLNGKDIKLTWEPGRFGWATKLARAYKQTNDQKYSKKFWEYLEKFNLHNPANRGPHWSSAQEVALRLISLIFSYSLLEEIATPDQTKLFAQLIAEHAMRIPATLMYAKAQRNNHLLTESAALYTAGLVLPNHPKSKEWKALGWENFIAAIEDQLHEDGTYMQHSSNYHRLMLHISLWMHSTSNWNGERLPIKTINKLEQAYKWLLNITESSNGRVPNLGANDGANILPFTSCDFSDFRPVLQASGIAFANERPFPAGPWDELREWLLPTTESNENLHLSDLSWGTLRSAKHSGRPSHSDQLHVDLWWNGINITQDAGTYSYNSNSPWNNSLKGADVHNTVTINRRDHMQSAGRFRWVNVAQGQILKSESDLIKATHDGYKNIGLEHIRELQKLSDYHWKITDTIQSFPTDQKSLIEARCHYLLPNWAYEIVGDEIHLESPKGIIKITFESEQNHDLDICVAGKQIFGEGHCPPHRGWLSKTYFHKEPALSLAFTIKAEPNFSFSTNFHFPK